MADITMDDLTIGAVVFDLFFVYEDRKYHVKEIEVAGPLNKSDRYIPMLDHDSGKMFKLFPGDRGVAPIAYDKRVTQVFKTLGEALDAIKQWEGRNPNFIMKE